MTPMVEFLVIVLSAAFTAIGVNTAISTSRRHQQRHAVHINAQHILSDAQDVSMCVQRLTEQLGGR